MQEDTRQYDEILIVDDTPATIGVVRTALHEAGYQVAVATTGKKAIEQVALTTPDLILLDILMPGMDGYETCKRLKTRETTKDIPIIFMTVMTEPFDKVKGFQLGAVDYLTKPVETEELLARVKTHLTIARLQQELQAVNAGLEQQVAARTAELQHVNQQLQSELAERKRAEEAQRRLNRELRAITNCNYVLMRAENEQTLLNDICRIVCDEAGYRMAWVGYAEHNDAQTVRPVAWAGVEEGYLATANITWADTERGRGPTGTAIRTGESTCIQNFTTDSHAAPWRENALQRGYRSSLALPLKDEHAATFGALNIYSTEPNAFTLDEIQLMEELANDLAFGIIVLHTRAERKRAEEALRASEARFADLFEKAPLSYQSLDINGHFLMVNEAWLETLGYTREEVIGKWFGDFLAPEFVEAFRSRFSVLKAEGRMHSEFEMLHKSGERRFISFEGRVAYKNDGSFERTHCIFQDITERKRSEEALRESERLLADIAANYPHSYLSIIEHDFTIGFTSGQEFTKQHLDPKSFEGLLLEQVFGAQTPIVREHYLKAFQGEETSFELFINNQHQLYNVVPLYDQHGHVTRILAVVENITERKQAERELQRSNDLLRAIIEAAPTAIIGLDLDGNVQMVWNPAAEKMLGWSAQEAMGHLLPSVPVESQEEFSRFREWIRSGKTLDGVEVRRQRRDGSPIDYNIYASPLHDTEGQIIGNVAVLVDITERKQTEAELTKHREHLEELVAKRTEALEQEILERKHVEHELQQAKDAAEAANRAKSVFLANMSHDLRTPLNVILGYVQLLKRAKNLTAKQRDQINTMYNSGKYLLTLIGDLLDLTKIEAQRMAVDVHPFHLPAFLRNILDASRFRAEERSLFVRYEEGSPVPAMVKGDERKLRQVLLNLLDNAIKYTEHGGVTLRVEAKGKRQKANGKRQTAKGKRDEEETFRPSPFTLRLCFEVEDTGIGISGEQMKAIFEPFTRVGSRSTEGIGLGLAICHGLVELMGGRLSVDSEVGKGSTFTVEVELAVAEAGEAEANALENAVMGYHGERKRLLIVDDNITNLAMLVSTLEPLGFEIETAESGEEALHKTTATPPDLILLDLLMPGMDGDEVLRQIRQDVNLRKIKVIGVSAAVADKARVEAFAAACDAFLAKPVDIRQLQEQLKAQLQLDWIEEKAEAAAAPDSTRGMPVDEGEPETWPPQTVVDDLLKKAEQGDFTRLKEILDRLEGEDNEYKGFCDKIRTYARRFDDDAIIDYLSQ